MSVILLSAPIVQLALQRYKCVTLTVCGVEPWEFPRSAVNSVNADSCESIICGSRHVSYISIRLCHRAPYFFFPFILVQLLSGVKCLTIPQVARMYTSSHDIAIYPMQTVQPFSLRPSSLPPPLYYKFLHSAPLFASHARTGRTTLASIPRLSLRTPWKENSGAH